MSENNRKIEKRNRRGRAKSRSEKRSSSRLDISDDHKQTVISEENLRITSRSHRKKSEPKPADPTPQTAPTITPPSDNDAHEPSSYIVTKSITEPQSASSEVSVPAFSKTVSITPPSELVKLESLDLNQSSNHLALDLDLTISGVARIFARHLKDRVAYIPLLGWYVYNGRVFENVEPHALLTLVEDLIHEVMKKKMQTSFRPKELLEAEKLLTPSKMKQILEMARAHLTRPLGVFDNQTSLLNTPAGLVHTDGSITPHEPGYHCRKMTNVSYASDSECPDYRRILDIAFDKNPEGLDRFLLTIGMIAFGLCEKRLILLKGGSATIKQIICPLQETLGTYARSSSMREAVIIQPKVNISNYSGTQMVVCTTEIGSQITDEELFSYLFKGENVVERREGSISLQPNHVIVADESLIRPSIMHMEIEGFEDFIEVFQVPESNIMNLSWGSMASPDEKAGIMKLLLESVSLWNMDGNCRDLGISEQTKRYIQQIVDGHPKKFIRLRTTVSSDNSSFSKLYTSYTKYCSEQPADPWSQKAFSSELKDLGYDTRNIKGQVEVIGINVKKWS